MPCGIEQKVKLDTYYIDQQWIKWLVIKPNISEIVEMTELLGFKINLRRET